MTEKVRVGSRVGVLYGTNVIPATVIEVGGKVGTEGDRVLVVRYEMPPWYDLEGIEVAVLESRLQPAPPPLTDLRPFDSRPDRRRKAARRKPAPA
jgi:hypothetical protein